MQHAFLLSLQLFCKTTMPFCTTKTSNLPVTHFYGGIVECAYQRFLLPEFMFTFTFFATAHFHLAPVARKMVNLTIRSLATVG